VKHHILTVVGNRIVLHGPYPSRGRRDRDAKEAYIQSDCVATLDIDRNGVPNLEQCDIRLIDPRAVVSLPNQLRLFPDAVQ
jgi:hypothetical protein